MKTKSISSVLFVMALLWTLSGQANNIQIKAKPTLTSAAANVAYYINFPISWDNSWKSSNPRNWDAAWIFAKYSIGGEEWKHVYLSNDSTQHQVVNEASGIAMTIECGQSQVESLGNALRTVGVFLRRVNNGNGTIDIQNMKLYWDYSAQGIKSDDPVTVRVFAMEMVYINRGAFYLGSGGDEPYGFRRSDVAEPFRVTSEKAIHVMTQNANNDSSLSNNANAWGANNSYIPADFPKGFEAFYMMKYEVSQEAWVDFVNTLNVGQQYYMLSQANGPNTGEQYWSVDATYVNTNNAFPFWGASACGGVGNHRQGIMLYEMKGAGTFVCNLKNDGFQARNVNQLNDGQNIPIGFINRHKNNAYLDWAGLRPLTEFEFEKAARGPLAPVKNEYVWGAAQTSVNVCGNPITATSNNGEPDEAPDKGNVNYCIASTNGWYGSPIRCGAFGSAASTRTDAGASYWGVMELSGNMHEAYVNTHFANGRTFDGRHGDGSIDANTGACSPTLNWPKDGNSYIFRGGCWAHVASNYHDAFRASGRPDAASTTTYNWGISYYGLRGGRSAGHPGK